MCLRKLALSVAGLLTLAGVVPVAQAVDIEAGEWTLSVNGNVNANYVYSSCDSGSPISFGGALAGSVVGACNINGPIDDDVSSVRTGLLPAALVFSVATQQNGWDLSGTFGLFPGIVTNDDAGAGGGSPNLAPGNNVALGSTSLDIRQIFLEFGNSEFGTVKAGRDFGLFGFDAIINDMSIPAAGLSTLAVGSPGNTTLGSIGFGYIYVDTLSQINYTTPDFGGFTATAGVFQTVDSLSAPSTLGVGETLPGFHGQLRYEWEGAFVSLNAVTLEVDGVNDIDTTGDGTPDTQRIDDERVYGVDLNYKQNLGAIDFLISGYYTDGLGSVAYLFDSFDAQGDKRDSYGGLAQVTYTAGKNKFGLNYGLSYLDQTGFDKSNVPNLFKFNQKITGGYYYSLTPNLTLTAEYSYAESENHAGDQYDANNVNAGVFFAF